MGYKQSFELDVPEICTIYTVQLAVNIKYEMKWKE